MKKLFLVLLTGIVLQSAFTQDSGVAGESDESLDFVITAGRTPEETNKVAGQVTVITADDIAESGASTITEVLESVPGIRLAQDRSGVSRDITMRGISSDYGRGKVLVIVDGMRLNPTTTRSMLNWDAINLSEVERIEILDGGASVQYGDNAQVGVINIITKKSGAAKTDITVSGGSFFQNEQRFSHHHPTGWGGFTVSGGHRGTQGYQKHSAFDTGNGELRGIFDINDTMSLQANVGFVARNGLFANPLNKAQFDDDPTQSAGAILSYADGSFSDSEIITGLGFVWAINETLNLDVPVSYSIANMNWNQPNGGMGAGMGVVYEFAPQMLGFRPKISAAFKPADMGLRLTGGVDMLFAFNEIKTSYDLAKESNPQTQTMSELTLGPWVLVNFEPFSFLSFNAGARYDTAFVKAHLDSWSGTVMGYPMSYTDGDESTDWNAFVYEAGFAVNPFDFLKVYAKYGTQFKYPYLDNIIVMPAMGGAMSLNTGLDPEKGWTVEGGIGLNVKDIVRLDANFYYLRIDNEITEIMLPSMSYVTVNMDPISRIGTDIGVKLTPFKKYVELDLDYGFVNAKFSEGANEGKFVPMVAEHTLSSSLMINLPFGLSLGPNMLYKSEMYQGLDYDNTQPTIDSSLIWGIQARYVINKFNGELAVQFAIHNLADTKYASTVYYLGPLYGTVYYVDPNMGRSVNVLLQYRF
ncbi:MAG: TonB-dependent receptor [Treponema sp.]|jgi:iron complex outermembrane receptor protein|nr:TonB-dependent receptor [Treponema sp.]